MNHLEIHHSNDLTLEQIIAVGQKEMTVSLAQETYDVMAERRQQIEQFVDEQDVAAYGFNRGFGHNVDLPVPPEELGMLHENLILSHAVGTSDHADELVVRITMLLRAKSISKGFSGVRPELPMKLLEFLNHNIVPVVPELGSVGASGDLSPLSHIALGVIGHGKVRYEGEIQETAKALEKAGISPIKLAIKEGLALNNGVQFMNAIGIVACNQVRNLLKSECIHTSMVAQVMLAPDTPYREDYHQVRPHSGAIKVARSIWNLMQNSPIREMHREYDIDGQIQDPYNLRCAAQILGTCEDLLHEAETTLLVEANSATDNPIILPLGDSDSSESPLSGQYVDIVSGGHFHGMPIAVKIYNLFQAVATIGNLAHQRSVRFVDQAKNKRLGRDLKWPFLTDGQKAISSGMMMLEYTSASLVNDVWGSCTPSHLFNISTNSGQEDHVSMGTSMAVRLLKTIPKVTHIQAIELAYLTQAITIRKSSDFVPSQIPVPESLHEETQSLQKKYHESDMDFEVNAVRMYHMKEQDKQFSPASEAVYQKVNNTLFPTVKEDRYMAEEVGEIAQWIASGEMVALVEPFVPL